MGFDSTAELLFKINANADDAQGNIQRFRNVLSKDLSTMGAEAEDWAKKTFGAMNTVQGAMIGGAAAIAAAVVAAGTAAIEMAHEYSTFVGEVARGSKMTGIGVEQMSALKEAAEETRTNYDSLVTGLTKFSSTIVLANEGNDQAAKGFKRLGISTAELKAGEQEMLPLLYAVADRFAGLKSQVEQAAIARDLFGRGGAEMIGFLRQGSAGLKQFGEDAAAVGKIVHQTDVEALREYKASIKEIKDQHEMLAMEVGRRTIPVMMNFQVGLIGLIEAVKQLKFSPTAIAQFPLDWMASGMQAYARVLAMSKRLKGEMGSNELFDAPKTEKVKEATQDFYGLSSVLEQVKTKLAGAQGEEAKAAEEMTHLQFEVRKATDEFLKLRAEGKLTGEAAAREAGVIAQLPNALIKLGTTLLRDLEDKRRQVVEESTRELIGKLEGEQEQTFELRERAFAREMDQLWTQLGVKDAVSAQNVALLEQIESAGLAKIGRERSAAYQQELVDLQQHLAQIVTARMTARERMAFQYQVDLQRYSKVEEEKALKLATSEEQRAIISAQYAMNRSALLQQYGNDVTALENSQGWQGVFGEQFAQLLAHDQEALREWAESADQAFNLVSQMGVMLEGQMQKTFKSFAQGMGQNIAQAIVYKKSIGEAMQAAVASTLAGLSAEALIYAIYSTGLGFVRLAQHDYPAATAAFTAAAIWGSVGVAAAVAGRMVAPSQGSSAAAGAGAVSGSGAGASSAQTGADAQQQASGPRVQIIVQGHIYGVSGVEELAQVLSDAVENRDVRLVSSQSRSAQPVVG